MILCIQLEPTDYSAMLFSVPGIAERIAFGTLKPDEYFMLFNKKNADLVELFRRNNVGGPAIIFDRHQETGKLMFYNCLNIILSIFHCQLNLE